MSFTIEDFRREYVKKYFAKLTPEEQREVVEKLPLEDRLVGVPPEQLLARLSPEQIRQYLEQLTADQPTQPRKPRRRK